MKHFLPIVLGLAFAILVILLAFSQRYTLFPFFSQIFTQKLLTSSSVTPAPQPDFTGTFDGTFACADCSGLETQLTINGSSAATVSGTFTLTEKYLGKSVKPIVTTGSWSVISGSPQHANSPIYELLPTTLESSGILYFLRLDADHLKVLDNQLQEIDSPFNQILTRQVATDSAKTSP